MPSKPPTFRPRGQKPQADIEREFDRARGSASARGYDWTWAKASKAHLTVHPLCAYCALHQRVTAARLVDHLYPHRGDRDLFWDQTYWVSSCADCHNSFKQALECRGLPALNALALQLGLPPRGGGGAKSPTPSPS